MSRSGQILEKKEDSISFVVDVNLPTPDGHLKYPKSGLEYARSILEDKSMSGIEPEILAMSCPQAILYGYGQDVFFQTMVQAYAEHRPVVISPDMIWLLICQGFSHHINMNPERYRERLVSHEGKKELVVEFNSPNDPTPDERGIIIEGFTKQVAENTHNGLVSTLIADYSTTGAVEAIASRITLLDAVKPFFEFVVHHCICGIPFITLKGTAEDWEKMIGKVKQLTKFDLEWWTDELIPILQEFVDTANGRPKASFWKSIVKTWRPEQLRGKGCIHEGPPPSTVNGWVLKFFPYNRDGRTPEKVLIDETMLPETVSVPFKYRLFDSSGNLIKETPMEMTAGFIGIEEDHETYALTPKIAWFISESESDEAILAKFKEKNRYGVIELRIQEVPSVLKHFKHINSLRLYFAGKVALPDWLEKIKIDYFVVTGEMTSEEKGSILKRFPNCHFWEKD